MLEENKLYYDLPMPEYLSEDAIGSGTLNYIVPPYTPRDYQCNLQEPFFKGSDAANLGTFYHSANLERDTFDDLYIYEPEKIDKRTKEGKAKAKEFAEQAAGKTVISFQDRKKIEASMQAFDAHPELKEIMAHGNAEVTGVARFAKHLVDGGLRYKAREDWICDDGWIYDIKTLSINPSDANLAKTIANYNYHFKAVHHMEVMKRCGVDVRGFGWIFMTTHLPVCHVVVKRMGYQMKEIAHDMWVEATALLANCVKTSQWPGYSENVEDIELPNWAMPSRPGREL